MGERHMITDPRSRTDRRRLLVSSTALAAAAGLPGGARAAAEPAFAEGYATSDDGTRLYLVRTGDGPLVLFLHGHPDSWALYDPQLRELARDHLAAAPNLRGYPPSDVPDPVEAYGMPRLLGDVHALLDHLGHERCAALVGNDWGGYVAWVFASAYPARVEHLVILNAQHPAVLLRLIRTDPAHNRAAQYERAFHAAPAPYPPWYNYYRADPIKVPVSVEEAAREPAPELAAAGHHLAPGGGPDPGPLGDARPLHAAGPARRPPRVRARPDGGPDRGRRPPPDAVASGAGEPGPPRLPGALGFALTRGWAAGTNCLHLATNTVCHHGI
jgi:pimeloyl-ACP methyl ester carboxylesterase